MRIPKTLLRTFLVAGAVLFLALAGGIWLTDAPGALAAPDEPVRAYDVNDPFNSAADTVLADNLVYWSGYYREYEPCAFFPTSWATPLRVSLDTNEACLEEAPNLDVLCIGPDEGVTATTVDNVVVDVVDGGSVTLSFNSEQDGHCMVTTAPAPDGAQDGYIVPALIQQAGENVPDAE